MGAKSIGRLLLEFIVPCRGGRVEVEGIKGALCGDIDSPPMLNYWSLTGVSNGY